MISESMNKPVYVDLRPLGMGIDRERPSHYLEKGFFLSLENLHLKAGGLLKRGSYSSLNRGRLPSIDRKIYGSPLFFKEDGEIQALLVSKKHLYRIDEDGDSEKYTLLSERLRTAFTGVFTVTGNTITLVASGETFESGPLVRSGDTVWLPDGEAYEILVVNSTTTLTLIDHTGSFTAGTYEGCEIYKGFRRVPDYTVYGDNFVFTDNSSRGLQVYDGTSCSEYNSSQAPPLTEIDTVTFFADRLWVSAFTEGERDERFRVRWSNIILDIDTPANFPVSQFVDLPIGRSPVSRLLPLGNLLVAYFRDRIFYGRPTNIVNLPYDFTPLDTGNVGIVGPRAVTFWLDSHWFVGTEDIYALSATRALERIGTRVIKDTIFNPNIDLSRTIVVPDPINERIVFEFFNSSDNSISALWSFYYKTQGWSVEYGPSRQGDTKIKGYFFGRTISTKTWEDFDHEEEEEGSSPSWDSEIFYRPWSSYEPVEAPEKNFILRDDGEIYIYDKEGSIDSYVIQPPPAELEDSENPQEVISSAIVLDGLFATVGEVAIPTRIESGDFDFGSPNVLKTVTQLSIKMEENLESESTFEVWGSSNRGGRKKPLGSIRIRQGSDEGKIDFRMTGSLFRFEIRGDSVTSPWTLNEIVLLAQEVGREHVFQ